jgi:sRNA-binding carbon storage regulator CsrA
MTVFYFGENVDDDVCIEAVEVLTVDYNTNKVRIGFLESPRANIEVDPSELYESWREAKIGRLKKFVELLHERQKLTDEQLFETENSIHKLNSELQERFKNGQGH